MISTTYDRLAKPFVSLREMNPFAFCWFFRLVEAQNAMARNQRRIRGSRGGRCASLQLGNGAASHCKSVRGSSLMFGRARFVLVEL